MHKNKKTLAIIPARLDSSRFPGKVLVSIGAKSMIQRVYEQAQKAGSISEVIVATGDERIFEHIQSFGGKVFMTRKKHKSGTDRCAEVIENEEFKEFEIILNLQGDQPFIQPQQVDDLVNFLNQNPHFQIATLVKKIESEEAFFNSNVVKVVFSGNQKALYFSRHSIPFFKNIERKNRLSKGIFYKHIGLYGFQKEVLLKISKLRQGPLEIAESLEQLRWLENGFEIGVAITELESIGVDTPEDLEKVLVAMRSQLF